MEKLIFLIAIVVISMLHSWWQKRKGEGDADADASPWPTPNPRRTSVPPRQTPQTRPQPPPAASWEDELRRLLQGEEPSRPAAPPVVVQSAPPPLPRASVSRPAPVPRVVSESRSDVDMNTGLNRQAPSMLESAQAFLHGSMPSTEVARHMQQAHPHVATHETLSLKKQVPPAIRQAVSLVRDRQSQRAAIIAGIILGPPKAMEV
ncbi:MAG: hypothetical protein IPK15_07570 [Verrucomicrobia bacterium]|nr:hypothetical protein [Verrucomicrobiota bacterium]